MAKRDRKGKKSKGRVLDFNEALEKKQRQEERRKAEDEEKARRLKEISNVKFEGAVKRGKKKTKRKVMFALIVILFFALILFYSLHNVVKLKIEEKNLKSQQEELIKEKKQLQKEIKKSGGKEHIENEARKQLKMIKPGEILFLLPKGDKKN